MSKLYIIPTPIGNLKDITIRAIEVLKEVDLILAEDTRKSIKLLNHFDITTPMSSYHQHNEHKKLDSIIEKLKSGKILALVSDAGTPSISDPGFLLVRECVENKIDFETLPGPTALIPSLINSSFSSERFIFEGFLPVKKGRSKRLNALKDETRTIILYESPHKFIKTINDLIDNMGSKRRISVSRELTKIYEETVRGDLSYILAYFKNKKLKGEFVIVIEGNK
ncbi:16S rRNA (cytidine(1402)-2'-O)-methyltransferase [Flavobacteriales bacterium]|nr:16S rRNA (cytidine(1402)-2'-O)-methyltransferase [Flavobacteriales bacterium]